MSNDVQKLQALCQKNYKDQAIWFLNSFWDSLPGSSEAERVWSYEQKIQELDEKKAEGSGVDEMQAHRFLEIFKEQLTVQQMRDQLRKAGAFGPNDRPKVVPLIHYLLIRYKKDFHTLVNAPQGNAEEIAIAKKKLDDVQTAFRAAEQRKQEADVALRAAQAAEHAAKQREAEAIQAEAQAKERLEQLRAAQAEVEAALAEVKAQEAAYNEKTEALKRASETGGQVSRNKAKNELAQHLGQDPLPLRKAKITQEAAVKKAEKAAQLAEEAKIAAENAARQASEAREQAEEASRRSEEAAAAAEAAVEEARAKVAEAEAYLEEAKARLPQGAVWWLERELHEAKKYLPKAKGGISKQ